MNRMQDPFVSLKLPLSAVNVLLQGAAELPYKLVAPVLHDVQQQVEPQLQQPTAGADGAAVAAADAAPAT